MTGFARMDGQREGFGWYWELKSVNGRALDLRMRLPSGYDALEQKLKQLVAKTFQRGTISATLTITEANRAKTLRINEQVFAQAVALLETIRERVGADPPRLDGLLALPGVMEIEQPVVDEHEHQARTEAVSTSFSAALQALAAARDAEGGHIAVVLAGKLAEIEQLLAAAVAIAAAQPQAIRQRFATQIEKLTDGSLPVTEERLAQEVALLIQKADIREELDRLAAHVQASRDLLATGTGIGRRLDFLCQEFNREANTVCSKSADLGLTRIGLDLKATIEQFREQIQNIE